MPATLYRIKLYGHSGGDTELFCKNLATILNIDEQRARTLLRQAPAIIKEGVDKAKAEAFCKLLEPIRALCIVEPVDGEVSEEAPAAVIASALRPESPEADDLDKRASRGFWIWMTALVVITGVFLLFIGGGFISSLWHVYRQNRPPATAPAEKAGVADTQAEPAPADDGPVSFEELQAQVDELEARIESNKFTLAQAEQVRVRLHSSVRSSARDLAENAQIIRDLNDQIRNDAAELKILKRRLEEIERGLEQR